MSTDFNPIVAIQQNITAQAGTSAQVTIGSDPTSGNPSVLFGSNLANPDGGIFFRNGQVVIDTGASNPPTKFQSPYSTAGSDATDKLCITELFIPISTTLTGIAVLNGSTVGTDNMTVSLFDAGGVLLANSAAVGEVTAGADAYQSIDFTSPVSVDGPATFFVGVAKDGTTDSLAVAVTGVHFTTQQTATFGVFADITTPIAFEASAGPIISTY